MFLVVCQLSHDVIGCEDCKTSLLQPYLTSKGLLNYCTDPTTLQHRRCSQTSITTFRQPLANVKGKNEPSNRQGAVYMIKCCDCQATYVGEAGRNLNIQLTEHKQATRNGDINIHVAEHHLQTNHRIHGDSTKCVTYSTDYYQRITLESWFTNLEQTLLNCCQQLPAPCKRLIDDNNKTDK